MKNFPAAFLAELVKKTGITPIWILRQTIDGVVYDLSDSGFTFPAGMANGFGATLPWVGAWGEVRESISGTIGEMLVSDFSATILNDQDITDNIRHLALNHSMEQNPAELYLWLDGLTNATPPQRLFAGYNKDIDVPDETQVHLTIEDESTRFQKYIGTRISSEVYPLCDPDVVGKLLPIVYGSVSKLPALCIDSGWVTSIIADISDVQTEITVSEVPAYSLTNKSITIDDEQMLVSGQSTVAGGGNLALASLGTTATLTAGSVMNGGSVAGYNPPNVINGDRLAAGWGGSSATNGGLYAWLGSSSYLATLVIDFGSAKSVTEVHIFSLQTNFGAPVDPTTSMTSQYALKTFKLQYWNGSAWVDIQSVVGNNLVWKKIIFSTISTSKIRIYVTDGGFGSPQYAAIAEVEVYSSTSAATTVGGKVLTVVRGQNSTAKVTHTKGSVVIEKKSTPLVYLLADHTLDAIGVILARVRGVNVDITANCTKYLGTSGNQLAAYPGKAAITIPDFAKVSQRISIALAGNVAASDPGHGHAAGGSTTIAFGPQSASGTSTSMSTINVVFTAQECINKTYKEYSGGIATFEAVGNIQTATLSISLNMVNNYTGWSPFLAMTLYLVCGGYRITDIYKWDSAVLTNWTPAIKYYSGAALQGNSVKLVIGMQGWGGNQSYNITFQASIASATRSGTYKPAGVTVQNNYAGVSVNNGTLGLSGNSVADVFVGDMILADVTRNISAPAAVIGDFLSTYCNDNTLTTVGTFPATYSLNGAITEYKKAIEWLDYLSFQCRAFFRKMGGISRLIVRDVNPALSGTIAACCLTDEGIKALSYKKAPISDVINKVKVLYSRDWTNSGKQSESYMQSVGNTDAASIAIFGEQERPDMFMLDFVTDASMANDLATFYLNFYANRKWRISFSTFLDNAKYEFGDVVQLSFANDLVGTIVEAGITPGGIDRIDKMNFVVEAAIIQTPDANGMTTLTGEQIHFKDGEVITYV